MLAAPVGARRLPETSSRATDLKKHVAFCRYLSLGKATGCGAVEETQSTPRCACKPFKEQASEFAGCWVSQYALHDEVALGFLVVRRFGGGVTGQLAERCTQADVAKCQRMSHQ